MDKAASRIRLLTSTAKRHKNGSSDLQNQFFICNTFLPSTQYLHISYIANLD